MQENTTTSKRCVYESLLREVQKGDISNGEVKCLPGGCIKDVKDEISNMYFKPNVIITQMGGNDVAKENATIEYVTEEYASLVTEVKTKFPETKLIVSGLPPRFPSDEIRTKIVDFNEAMRKWSEQNELQFVSS